MKNLGPFLLLLSACGGVVRSEDLPDSGNKKRDAGRDAQLADRVGDPDVATLDSAAEAYPVFHEDACSAQESDPLPMECDPLGTGQPCPGGSAATPFRRVPKMRVTPGATAPCAFQLVRVPKAPPATTAATAQAASFA